MSQINLYPRAESYARFARFVVQYQLDADDAARLVILARKAFSAGVRNRNIPNATKVNDKAQQNFEDFANQLGFVVRWDGLWPTINKKDAFGYED